MALFSRVSDASDERHHAPNDHLHRILGSETSIVGIVGLVIHLERTTDTTMRAERSMIRRLGAAVADHMVSASSSMEETAQLVPSSSLVRMSSSSPACPRSHPNEGGGIAHIRIAPALPEHHSIAIHSEMHPLRLRILRYSFPSAWQGRKISTKRSTSRTESSHSYAQTRSARRTISWLRTFLK